MCLVSVDIIRVSNLRISEGIMKNHGTRKKENFRLWEEKPKNNGFSESWGPILKISDLGSKEKI